MERLDKILSGHGFGTRREVRELIRAGRVQVAGSVVLDPGLGLDPARTPVSVDGTPVRYERHRHLLLHKPAGVITAARDRCHRTVLDLVPAALMRPDLQPVGRLDLDTEGLLLLTTDGELAHRLISPRYHVPKEYCAWLDGPVGAADVAAFAAGLVLADGTVCRPARLELGQEAGVARVTLTEGKYHQVRRMFAARGLTVLRLVRTGLGPLTLAAAPPAAGVRPLLAAEAEALYNLVCLAP